MSHTGFLSTSNTEMLWNIIIDNVVISTKLNESMLSELHTIFHKNLIPFFESERKTTNDLIVLNKKYISWLLANINQFVRKNAQQVTKSTADNKLITVEEIHKNRQTQFEQDLNVRQQEFTSYMTLKTPEVPKFSIDLNDEIPIKELEQTIKQMAAQRNYDIDIINKNNANQEDVQNWLTPAETSIKNEKYTPQNNATQNNITNTNATNNNTTNNKLKYIKIDTINLDSSHQNHIIDLNKHITWKDQMPLEPNIFDKLKKINIQDLKDFTDTTDINSQSMHNDSPNNIIVMQNDITNLSSNIHEMQSKINDMNNSIEQILKLLNKNE